MRFRGTPTYGGVTYYRLIGSAFEGDPTRPGDALPGASGYERRDGLLRDADALTTRISPRPAPRPKQEPTNEREDPTPGEAVERVQGARGSGPAQHGERS